jgi:hypothetical protein
MADDDTTHENHYCPQSWLRLWCGPSKKLWSYRRLGNGNIVGPDEIAPRGTGKERDLYTLTPESETHELGVPIDDIEKNFFGSIDDEIAPLFPIILEKGPGALAPKSRKSFARFIIALYDRSYSVLSKRMETATRLYREMHERPASMQGVDPRKLPGATTDPEAVAKNLVLRTMKSRIDNKDGLCWVLAAHWQIMQFEEDRLLTSDVPLLVGYRPTTNEVKNLTFAIDPRTLLVIVPDPIIPTRDEESYCASHYVMHMLRSETARCIYMRERPDAELEKGITEHFGPLQPKRLR